WDRAPTPNASAALLQIADRCRDQVEFSQCMGELEQALEVRSAPRADDAAAGSLEEDMRLLHDRIARSEPIIELLRTSRLPRLSPQDPQCVAALLGLARMQPEPDRMLHVNDLPFQRIADLTAQLSVRALDADDLLRRDLTKWILMLDKHAPVMTELQAMVA